MIDAGRVMRAGWARRGSTAAALAAAAVALLAPAAADAQYERGEGGARPVRDSRGALVCGLLPRWDCVATLHLELGLGGGTSATYAGWEEFGRAFAELGVLFAVPTGSTFHVGPVAEIGYALGTATHGFHINPEIRGRWWIGASNWTLEGSLGGSIARIYYNDRSRNGWKAGVALEAAFTYHAHFGLFVSGEQLFDVDVGDGAETRLLAGVRGSLIGMGIFVCAILTKRLYWYD